ncbi:putative acetyltransferase [Barrientosiimonas humi]|uniref:Putative acetyltransferase n=1 Tax=Barrientosiimonas humi TaxID=999931 RepID=A0A542X891_9MICO|nr:N-acetyltransferase [Barrientosiimonas humi]TQL32052.1 putative acetyltransferase [Barrientosiimonas humi]CAG7571994.1 hypothetical protein BH39T_PBIAJDOK_00651 [Barrientosiimonas humi]
MTETARPQIRPEQPADLDAVLDVIRAAFAGEGEQVAAIWREIAAGAVPHAGLVAVVDDRVVGHVGLSHGWLDARRALVDITVLSPLSVLPDLQSTGIGTALLGAAVERARTMSPLLVLEGSPAYYGPRGFAPGSAHGVRPASDRTPAPACQVVLGEGYEEWMTGRVVYREVWWRHDAAGLRDPELAQIEQALGVTPPMVVE